MPSLILCAEILDYLGDAAITKLVFVVFRAFVGFVHDKAPNASVMTDEIVLLRTLLGQKPFDLRRDQKAKFAAMASVS